MTDHYQAMIDALKQAARESRKALQKADEALSQCSKARKHLDKLIENHKRMKGEVK